MHVCTCKTARDERHFPRATSIVARSRLIVSSSSSRRSNTDYALLVFISKYLYVGFSYPFICMLATWRSSGDAAGSRSSEPSDRGRRWRALRRITITPTMITTKTVMPPTAIPSGTAALKLLTPFTGAFWMYGCNNQQTIKLRIKTQT